MTEETSYPKLDMPQSPDVAHKDAVANPDCKGYTTQEIDPSQSKVPPPPEGKKRILIGIPLLSISYEFFESFLKFYNELLTQPDERFEVGYHFAYRKPVHMAEEYLVQVAQYNKCTHILFMDDDIFDVTKADLIKLLEADKDVIGGVMHTSKFPHAMCVFRRYNKERKVIDMPVDQSMYRLYEVPCTCPKCNATLSHWDMKFCPACGSEVDNMIQQADLIPFAFTLIKLSVFDKIKKPWFHCTNKYPTDSWFADRLIEAGLTEYAHMGIRLNHNGVNDLTKPYLTQIGTMKAQANKAIVSLTPEQMENHQRLLLEKMKEAEDKLKATPTFKSADTIVNPPQPGGDFTLNTKIP